MRKIAIASIVLGMFAALTLPSSSASVLSSETWVSGTGSDMNNNCFSQATPCREIYTALSNTSANGTVHVLPGYYLGVPIDKGVDVIADQGQAIIYAAYQASDDGFYGIYVHAGAGDTVRIRGLTINEDYLAGGIYFDQGAALHLENCTMVRSTPITAGLKVVPATAATGGVPTELSVRNSIIGANRGGNVLIAPTNGVAVAASFDNTLMIEGTYGIRADTSAGSGLIRVDVTNSRAKGNTNNGYLAVGTGSNAVHFMIDRSTAENNGAYGAVATGSNAFMIVTYSTLMGNGTGLAQQSGATVASTGTNTINFNTTNTSGTITPITPK